METAEFERRLDSRDPHLFDTLLSQTSSGDRRSLLLIQKIFRKKFGDYNYLEIGSYRGGSLQPLVLDSKCKSIFSIDRRDKVSKDSRGWDEEYSGNTTEAMLAGLEKISERSRSMITAHDGASSEVPAGALVVKPNLMFIDGEHTERGVLQDWEFCSEANPQAVIYFHDSHIVYHALEKICGELEKSGKPFIAYNLPDHVFVIERQAPYLADDPEVQEELKNNYRGYIAGMMFNQFYREFYSEKSTKIFREVRNKGRRFPGWLRRKLGFQKK